MKRAPQLRKGGAVSNKKGRNTQDSVTANRHDVAIFNQSTDATLG
jgi:hypothetical protein